MITRVSLLKSLLGMNNGELRFINLSQIDLFAILLISLLAGSASETSQPQCCTAAKKL